MLLLHLQGRELLLTASDRVGVYRYDCHRSCLAVACRELAAQE